MDGDLNHTDHDSIDENQPKINGHAGGKLAYEPGRCIISDGHYFDPRELEHMPNINAVWGCCVIEELCRNGITMFFVSPGSRSAPLALGVAQSQHAQYFVAHDERGAAFLAVGYARAKNHAAAIITTSGTAVANLLPGTVEAAMDELPSILLTADRPPELQYVGANQAIIQRGIFGEYVEWSKEIACPGTGMSLRNVLSDIDYAVYKSGSAGTLAGAPVHINMMFRESLAPNFEPWDPKLVSDIGPRWRATFHPLTECARISLGADVHLSGGASEHLGARIWDVFQSSTHGVILLGGGPGAVRNEREGFLVYEMSSLLGWPIVSDVCGGLRFDATREGVVHYADLVLAASSVQKAFVPDCVLQFGERVTSKRTKCLVKDGSLAKDDFVHVLVSRGTKRCDEGFTVTHRVCGDIRSFATLLQTWAHSDRRNHIRRGTRERKSELWRLLSISAKTGELLDEQMKEDELLKKAICEKWLVRTLSQCFGCTRLQAIFVGNSMPIRDLDMFGSARVSGLQVRVVANRGASGIDGLISSGIGFALGSGVNTVIIVGDMSILHDVNALHLLRKDGRGDNAALVGTVTIVVVNNGGGGIFAMLPVGNFDHLVTPMFDSKHAVRFEGICASFGIKYRSVVTSKELRLALNDDTREHMLVEVLVTNDHKLNALHHSTIKEDVGRMADSVMKEG